MEGGRELPAMTATIGEVYLVFPLVELVCNDLACQARDSSKTSVCTESLQGASKVFNFHEPPFDFLVLQNMVLNGCG